MSRHIWTEDFEWQTLSWEPNYLTALRETMDNNNNGFQSELNAFADHMQAIASNVVMPSTSQAINIAPHMTWDRDTVASNLQFQAFDPISLPQPNIIHPQFMQEYGVNLDGSPHPAKPKKPAKLKKANENQVAKAIVKHSKKKTEQVKRQADMLDATVTQTEERLKNDEKQLRKTKTKAEFFKKQSERLNKNAKELEKEFAQNIKNLKEQENVADITIDDRGRIVITTAPLFTTFEDWDEPKMAGRYQIRIDFSRSSVHSGIRVLNITQRKDEHYDSPTISNTLCCWGNLLHDISTVFLAQDLEEIVNDMIAYISSPNTQHGYLGMEGSKNRGWDSFFDKITDMPDNYSWEQYDAAHPNENDDYPDEVDNMWNMPRDSIAVPADYRDDHIRNLERRLQDMNRQVTQARNRNSVQADNVEDQKLKLLLNYIGLTEYSQDYVFSHFRSNGTTVMALRLLPVGGRETVTLRIYREHEPTREISITHNDFAGSRLEETIREESAVSFDLNTNAVIMDITQRHAPIGTNTDDPSSMTQTRHRETIEWEVMLREYRRDENRPRERDMLWRYADASGAMAETVPQSATVNPVSGLAAQYQEEIGRQTELQELRRRHEEIAAQHAEAANYMNLSMSGVHTARFDNASTPTLSTHVTGDTSGVLALGRLGEMLGINDEVVERTEDEVVTA